LFTIPTNLIVLFGYLMKQIFSLLTWINKSKHNKRGNCPIYIRITIDGKRAEIATGKRVEPNKWNVDAGLVQGRSEEAKTINDYLQKHKVKLTKIHDKLEEEEKFITAEEIKAIYTGKQQKRRSLMEVFKVHNKR